MLFLEYFICLEQFKMFYETFSKVPAKLFKRQRVMHGMVCSSLLFSTYTQMCSFQNQNMTRNLNVNVGRSIQLLKKKRKEKYIYLPLLSTQSKAHEGTKKNSNDKQGKERNGWKKRNDEMNRETATTLTSNRDFERQTQPHGWNRKKKV